MTRVRYQVQYYARPHRALRSLVVFTRAGTSHAPWVVPVLLGYGVHTASKAGCCELHQHRGEFSVIVVSRGRYRCRVNEVPLTLRSGDVLIVKPGDWHADNFEPGLRFFTVGFRLDGAIAGMEAARLFRPSITPAQQCVHVDWRVFGPLMARIQAAMNVEGRFSVHIEDALIREFFWRLVDVLPVDTVCPDFIDRSDAYHFRHRLESLFAGDLTRRLSVADMARSLHLGESTLLRCCKRYLGESPHLAFQRHKVEQAERLLWTSHLPVKEISDLMGFSNPYHFSRVFKRLTGQSPQRFRARIKGQGHADS